MRLQHVSSRSRGRGERARAFYGGLLGLEEKPVPPKLDPDELIWFRAGGDLELHLMLGRRAAAELRTSVSRSTATSTSSAPGSKQPESRRARRRRSSAGRASFAATRSETSSS